jgi:hypothetical protein
MYTGLPFRRRKWMFNTKKEMKAKLIKTSKDYYHLVIEKSNYYYGHTSPEFCELQNKDGSYTHKLSLKNCDEIFGVVDVEKLAEKEVFQEYYDWGGEVFSEDYLISKRLHFIEGFNKAMELNKDKVFTVEDMHEALHLMNNTPRVPIVGEALEIVRKETEVRESIVDAILVSKQPKEIAVEVEMEIVKEQLSPGATSIEDSDWVTITRIPKLDENDCLILTKAEQ